jgi:hypothetical protein
MKEPELWNDIFKFLKKKDIALCFFYWLLLCCLNSKCEKNVWDIKQHYWSLSYETRVVFFVTFILIVKKIDLLSDVKVIFRSFMGLLCWSLKIMRSRSDMKRPHLEKYKMKLKNLRYLRVDNETLHINSLLFSFVITLNSNFFLP